MNAIDFINSFTPGVNYGDMWWSANSWNFIVATTRSERVKWMYVIVHDKYLPDIKIVTYLGLVLAT